MALLTFILGYLIFWGDATSIVVLAFSDGCHDIEIQLSWF